MNELCLCAHSETSNTANLETWLEAVAIPHAVADATHWGHRSAMEMAMGRAKAAMMEHEDNLVQAAGYLVKKDVLEHCDFHGEIYGGGWELEDEFWRNAMADRKRGDNGPIPWAAEMGAREFTDLLKEAYENHSGDECGYCAKNMDD